ncbi:hypothetical protein H6F77_22020 [Microcoleus sp. FACHB-831]|uniref:hypothetical protein n=1 Tax=Microcoleus sp. FACHB-831 TaxID=2692827 RepID=UPI001684C671|nr:hypothetical protein [Microcoleus sp. FACHB-831]MBD1923723.1 hypothetical protein [Microcoleus sp. FACHB-831]
MLKDGTTQQAAITGMKGVKLSEGVFQFTHKDARWWSGRGKYSFTYGNIPAGSTGTLLNVSFCSCSTATQPPLPES